MNKILADMDRDASIVMKQLKHPLYKWSEIEKPIQTNEGLLKIEHLPLDHDDIAGAWYTASEQQMSLPTVKTMKKAPLNPKEAEQAAHSIQAAAHENMAPVPACAMALCSEITKNGL